MKFFVSWGASINECTEAELGHQMSFASTSLSTVSSTLSQIWHQVPCNPCSTPTKGPAWAELGLNEDLYKHGMVRADAGKPLVNGDVVKRNSGQTSISGSTPLRRARLRRQPAAKQCHANMEKTIHGHKEYSRLHGPSIAKVDP